MADFVPINTAIVPGSNTTTMTGGAAVTINAGRLVYIDPVDNLCKLADANGIGSSRRAIGMAAHISYPGQPVTIMLPGSEVNMNPGLVPGLSYYLSRNAGAFCPYEDLLPGDQIQLIGVAKSDTVLALSLYYPNVVR